MKIKLLLKASIKTYIMQHTIMNNEMYNMPDPKEKERLQAMKEYNILEIDFDFSYILESLLEICEVPFCSITAIYKDNYHVIDSVGFETERVFPRDGSCTEYVHKKNRYCELPNVQEETEIKECAKLLNNREIIFYAGIPIYDSEGFTLGILNILDWKTKVLTEKQKHFIKMASLRIAKVVVQSREGQRLLHFDNMFSKSKDIMGIIRFDGVITSINPAFYELLEYSEHEVLQNNILDFIHPEYIDEAKSLINHLHSGKAQLNYTLPCVTKDNDIKWIEWTSTPEEGTELIYFIGRDITTIEKQSVLLKNSEARFRSFFENSQIALFIHDMQLNIISANKHVSSVIGVSLEEIVGKNLADFLPKNRKEYIIEYLRKLKEEGVTNSTTYVVGKDGKETVWLYNAVVEKTTVDVPLQRTGKVSGKLYYQYDARTSEQFDKKYGGLRLWATATDGQKIEALSNANGEFTLFLPVGEYEISVDANSLPQNVYTNFEPQTVTVAPDQTVKIPAIELKIKQRKIEIKLFGN